MEHPRIVQRWEWGARAPKLTKMTRRSASRITDVVFHYADLAAAPDFANEASAVRSIQAYHQNVRGWADIGYNAIVGQSGNIYDCRDHLYVPAHCEGVNTPSVGVCFLTRDGITLSAGYSAQWLTLLSQFVLGRKLRKSVHSDHVATACPGDMLRDWLKHVTQPGQLLA
jgi:hypothetical protein